jgi:ferredoxin-thioredoxin reductase catalytic subunit
MARYIDSNKLIEAIRYKHKPILSTGSLADVFCNSIEKTITEQIENTSADVVEVVRCKDCAYCYNNPSLNTFWCRRFTAVVDPNHFCSYGRRKTIKIRLNPDKETVEAVRSALKETGGYCPCALTKTDDTKCMCKDFRDQVSRGILGECHCGLYEAVIEKEGFENA